MYAAYKHVILSIMLAEATFYAQQLQLPLPNPILEKDVSEQYIAMPEAMWPNGAGGRIDVGAYSFGFATGAHHGMRLITKARPFGVGRASEENELLARDKSMIDTNGAYMLATNWLYLLQVDIKALEMTNYGIVEQRMYYSDHGIVKLPVFTVTWGPEDLPIISVVIDGRTKQVVSVRQDSDEYSRRPAELIKDLEDLLSLPDKDFSEMTSVQKSNLVKKFAVLDYSQPSLLPTNAAGRYYISNDYRSIRQKVFNAHPPAKPAAPVQN